MNIYIYIYIYLCDIEGKECSLLKRKKKLVFAVYFSINVVFILPARYISEKHSKKKMKMKKQRATLMKIML